MQTDTINNFKEKIFSTKNTILHSYNPMVMGILNITPDSFYDGGKYTETKKILQQAKKILQQGAEIIDIGAYSTRPGASDISEEEELKRLIPIIKLVKTHFPTALISADTFRAKVAISAIDNGANIINDISGGTLDKNMFATIAQLKVPYILTHIKGTPQNMQSQAHYENITGEVKHYFTEKLNTLNALGVNEICIDPGFGFSKTIAHNYELLNNLSSFKTFKLPLLCGISRKGMVYKLLETKPTQALNGTTVLNTIALMQGANILRVHDVKAAKEVIKIVNMYQSFQQKK